MLATAAEKMMAAAKLRAAVAAAVATAAAAAATAAAAVSQELWTSGGALFQRAQEPNIPCGESLTSIWFLHTVPQGSYQMGRVVGTSSSSSPSVGFTGGLSPPGPPTLLD